MIPYVDLRAESVVSMVYRLRSTGRRYSLFHADPPWSYSDGGKGTLRGIAPCYHGAEIDATRHAAAMALLAQQEIELIEPAQPTLYPIQEILI